MRDSAPRHELPGRLLRLLALLSSRREWSGRELADRLGVTDRTIRRDVDRLRALDYPVTGTTGTAGGYRMAAGRELPPLLLDDDEAVAVALGLVGAAAGGVAGVGESAARALAKLERVLPARLRPRLAALAGATSAVPAPGTVRTDPEVLAVLAEACRDREVLRLDHRAHDGTVASRRVEPYHLVTVRGRWYLVAYDEERDGWRTFRADRIRGPRPGPRRFVPRELPAPDPVTFVGRSLASATYENTARLEVALPAAEVRARIWGTLPGEVTARGPDACTVRLSARRADLVVQYAAAVAGLGGPVTVDATPEVADRLRALGANLATNDHVQYVERR